MIKHSETTEVVSKRRTAAQSSDVEGATDVLQKQPRRGGILPGTVVRSAFSSSGTVRDFLWIAMKLRLWMKLCPHSGHCGALSSG